MILAGIDIGTNTVRLLIADLAIGSYHEIYSDRKTTRLGQDLDRTGRLAPAAEERSLLALFDFAERIRHYGAIRIAAIGTSALRNASNSSEFLAVVRQRTGLDIRIITGEEEARLTLRGVTQALRDTGHWSGNLLPSALVIDIGGGSTEIIAIKPGQEPLIASLPLGAVYLAERFVQHDPPAKHEIELLKHTIREAVRPHAVGINRGAYKILAGTAGTITTIAAMDQCLVEYDPGKINGYLVTRNTIDGIVEKLIGSTLDERQAMPGLEQGREDIMLPGAIIAQEIMSSFCFSSLIVSDWGLREGIVLDLFEKVSSSNRPSNCV
jgi:exopolyphosphatase / guanosine-5'-triphosphate,3'-diphosphate pyrophosphatase